MSERPLRRPERRRSARSATAPPDAPIAVGMYVFLVREHLSGVHAFCTLRACALVFPTGSHLDRAHLSKAHLRLRYVVLGRPEPRDDPGACRRGDLSTNDTPGRVRPDGLNGGSRPLRVPGSTPFIGGPADGYSRARERRGDRGQVGALVEQGSS